MSRDEILDRVRTALGRQAGQAVPLPPPARIRIPEATRETRISSLLARVDALAGRGLRAPTREKAGEMVRMALGNRSAIASNAPILEECGITRLPGVRSGITDREQLRELCASAEVGITSADYALADTGTLVMLSSPREARMISLLPPAHIAVIPGECILSGLDELFSILPNSAEITSSMVLITGPSRTADIEQILVRGVHGPGEIMVLAIG
ncbi:MAG TPA: lactate utilization protein [Bryobacteraceae bacterium]|jgi:L-lactate utilization protein LutC|nr:lactate utilization protein [Bryobacteraceae bacterium]